MRDDQTVFFRVSRSVSQREYAGTCNFLFPTTVRLASKDLFLLLRFPDCDYDYKYLLYYYSSTNKLLSINKNQKSPSLRLLTTDGTCLIKNAHFCFCLLPYPFRILNTILILLAHILFILLLLSSIPKQQQSRATFDPLYSFSIQLSIKKIRPTCQVCLLPL